MLAILAAKAVAANAEPAPPACALSHLDRCRNTNVLVWEPAFEREMRRFVGRGHVSYLYEGRLDDQQMAVLGGPPDEPARIGDLYRFTACRAHSCDEKGAVVLTRDGHIVATAILHSCAPPKRGGTGCRTPQVLTIFVRDPSGSEAVIQDVYDWAKAQAAASNAHRGLPPDRIVGLEVFKSGSGHPTRYCGH